MAFLDLTAIAGFCLLAYLSTFLLLATVRIATGISVQRIGLSSFRHVSYTPKEGIRVDIRGLGLAVHRPTFAQPTWLSLRLQELCVTIDPAQLVQSMEKHRQDKKHAGPGTHSSRGGMSVWQRLTKIKEQLKQLHHKINWLRMLDVYATNTSLDIVGVGSISIGSITLAVHTRRKLLDRGRLFRHKKDASPSQRPAEWIFTLRGMFLAVSSREPVEILDTMSINVHGLLYASRSGLRDTSIAMKIGRLHVPLDDLLSFRTQFTRKKHAHEPSDLPESDMSLDDVVDELARPGSSESAIVETVAESKEFFSSVLGSVQELQVGMSFLRVSKEVVVLRQANLPIVMNAVTHEIGVDLHRMRHNSPAHRMYFNRQDIAHQALVAAVSMSVSLDEDDANANRILYVPMATMTVRTTVPSKTMELEDRNSADARNANVFFSNLVVTSPAVDLNSRHLVQLLAVTQKQPKYADGPHPTHHRIISKLLPRASIKLSIHEPVVRFVLPVAGAHSRGSDEYDMIIAAVSSIAFDVESSHSIKGELLYSLSANSRITHHKLYYQAASGVRHKLLMMDSLELNAQVTAADAVHVVLSGSLRSFSLLILRTEVTQSIYNIVRHFQSDRGAPKESSPVTKRESMLRELPAWLLEVHLEGAKCGIEVAGKDETVSKQTRGVAFELESWKIDYTAHRMDSPQRPVARRMKSTPKHASASHIDTTLLSPATSPHRSRTIEPSLTDGRRLTTHVKGFHGFIIESIDKWEPKPFLLIPKFEVAASTMRDTQGPTCHVHAHLRALYLDFSLYRVYSLGVAASVIQDTIQGPPDSRRRQESIHLTPEVGVRRIDDESTHKSSVIGELLAVDVKAGYIQVKGRMPHDPAVMLQIYDVSAGQHRWSAPFLRSHLVRLHAASPHAKNAWARIVSVSNVRVDLRSTKKRLQHETIEQKSVDVSTDFIRIGVPHGLRMFKVFDNFVNTNKAMVQLAHKFRTRTNEYILRKGPEKPKIVPRISLRSKALMFELEDDAFEYHLASIFHVGRNEQRQRLAREDAFKLKLRKMQDERGRTGSNKRARSAHHTSRGASSDTPGRHSRSQDSITPRRRSTSRGRPHNPSKLRYDREGTCHLTSSAKVQSDDAWTKLQQYNARSWKTRINTLRHMQSSTVRNIRRMFSGADEPPPDVDDHESVLGIPNRPGLLTIVISDLHLVVDRPSFPLSSLPDFMHEVGKGMPRDMEYALLIPMSLALDMGEARFMLRDYPLNLLHVPAIRPGQSPRLPAWSLRTDFVVAEEYRDDHSIRHVQVEIVPKGKYQVNGEDIPSFTIDVRRTVSPVKTYSRPVIDINTSAPTSISWGTSYQPAIQDVMMIIESFTKPELDPSDRVGFWDKIRLSFHSRPLIQWKGDGDVQLRLKGSRDPYIVTGYGAGFVMCWRNNVRWAVHETDDPREFMTVKSGEYVLAIPDYSHKARSSLEENIAHDMDSTSTSSSMKNAAVFSKVIMKVSGNVQWRAGLVFEQDKQEGRTDSFRPHYSVVLRNPKMLNQKDLEDYDAFRGFRSQHIHMSITLAAPVDRDWTSGQSPPSMSYNSVHLTPRFFSHFYAWWGLFSGVMALPIRQGALWKGPEKTSKKFGRHLSTIKYGLLLSPLFIAHVYKHKDPEDYEQDTVFATGLKLKLDSFMLDLHQRREWFDTLSKNKNKVGQMRTSAMKINRAELDFVNADLRAVAAEISGTTAQELKRATDEMLSAYAEPSQNADMSKFTIPDHDFSWIDMDDFTELDWILPADSSPETKILPVAFTPRFTYFRQTDHGNAIHGDARRTSPFGKEDTHMCIMPARHNDPRKIQMYLLRDRIANLDEQLQIHQERMDEHEVKLVREVSRDNSLREEKKAYEAQLLELREKKRFLQNGLERLAAHEHHDNIDHTRQTEHDQSSVRASMDTTNSGRPPNDENGQIDMSNLYSASNDELASDFNNRFIVHNAQLKWNNALRNIILRYSHQVSQRRGFVYYMSRRAVKFILDIVEEQAKKKRSKIRRNSSRLSRMQTSAIPETGTPTEDRDEDVLVQERIKQLLDDANKFVNAEDAEGDSQDEQRDSEAAESSREDLAEEFQAMNSYNIRLIAPQIQLQSDRNVNSVVLLTAKGMQLKIVAVMDKNRLSDEVSGLVQRRFSLDMDGVQIFVANLKRFSKFIHLYSGNKYGNTPGSSWPPWAGIEAMFDFQIDPFGFQRVVQKTSASLRYEKYNPLRLKYNEQVADGSSPDRHNVNESGIDHLWVDFPRLRASCDSLQYYTMYIIVMDLLMYSEPLEKTRSERLEKIMLASDFSDLRGAPEMAENLQGRIRQLGELKNQFLINARYLDKQGWQDRIDLEKDLTTCEDELFFIMKAINTSQQRSDERTSQSSGFLRWYLSASQVVWHLMKDKNEPLMEFQLGNATYERIDNSDGSNYNAMAIGHIRGWNLLPNAMYPEIIGPYDDPQYKQIRKESSMLQVHWIMLEAIAGIPVLEEFEVTLHPLKVQLERSLGKALFEYIFPGQGVDDPEKGNSSPFMVKNMKPIDGEGDEEMEKAMKIVSPKQRLPLPSKDDLNDSSPGGIGSRLQPTYNLRRNGATVSSSKRENRGLGISGHRIGLFRNSSYRDLPSSHALVRQSSNSSIRSLRGKADTQQGSTTSLPDSANNQARSDSRERRGFRLHRQDSDKDKNKKANDDVSEMVARASNYMTLAFVKLNSFVICLSYKGERDRNLVDLHDFVFRMPALEYENKTWSNLDLAMHLKRDVIRALVSHTPAIIGNKFSHHRPGKKQAEKLREMAATKAILPNSNTLVNTPSASSDGNSLFTDSEHNYLRTSFQSDSTSDKSRPLEPSLLLDSHEWRGQKKPSPYVHGDGEQRDMNVATSQVNEDDRVYVNRNSPFSPTSPGRIDPLAPIPSAFARPSTSSSFIPAKSLLKDVVGRHFPLGHSHSQHGSDHTDDTDHTLRPTIHNGRVRFTSRKSHYSERESSTNTESSARLSDTNMTRGRERSGSAPGRPMTNNDNAATAEPFKYNEKGVPLSLRRKGLTFLGKKVLSGLGGNSAEHTST